MDAHDFVTFSVKKEITPRSPSPLAEVLHACLADYVEALGAAGCSMVGHIKGVLEDGDSPPLFFSITSITGEPQLKGGPLVQEKDLMLTMTVIVSGMETGELSRLLDDSLERYFISMQA